MKNIKNWVKINGSYVALAEGNVIAGYIKDIKTVTRPERVVDEP